MVAYRLNNRTNYVPKVSTSYTEIKAQNLDYCAFQQSMIVFWYKKVTILITYAFMLSFFNAAAMAIDLYVYYVG